MTQARRRDVPKAVRYFQGFHVSSQPDPRHLGQHGVLVEVLLLVVANDRVPEVYRALLELDRLGDGAEVGRATHCFTIHGHPKLAAFFVVRNASARCPRHAVRHVRVGVLKHIPTALWA